MTEVTHMCSPCAAGVPGECENPEVVETTGDGFEWIIPCAVKFNAVQNVAVVRRGDGAGRPVLSPGEITDPTSTGRKRAAMLAPILTGSRCEWAGLRHAGGGVVPIAGCDGHLLVDKKGGDKENDLYQGDLHHGPDKNTINNAVGTNLHRICVDCHHRWHAANDQFYDKEGRPGAAFPFLPVDPYFLHDPSTLSSDEDYLLAEEWWKLPKKDRGPYPFAPDPARKVLPLELDLATLSEGNPFPDSPFTEIGDS